MRPLIISTYDNAGGAARSAFRLHQGLRSLGVASKMLVQFKVSNDPAVDALSGLETLFTKIAVKIEARSLRRYSGKRPDLFSTAKVPSRLVSRVQEENPDVVNLHWVAGGMASPESLRRLQRTIGQKPVVWTLHDMWPFTGGCHYDDGCGKFRVQCGACPALGSHTEHDLSRELWQRKQNAWSEFTPTLVTPSHWLARMANDSSLFGKYRLEVIPYGINTDIFLPGHKQALRAQLGLHRSKNYILFTAYGAQDPRKGFQFLSPLMREMQRRGLADNLEIVVLGSKRRGQYNEAGYVEHHFGLIEEERTLAEIYGACDLLFAPSTQDNLPNTVLEALACGLPTLAFRIGGIPDMIESGKHGILASPFEVKDLADGLSVLVRDRGQAEQMGKAARERALRDFPLRLQAERYQKLYCDLVH